MIVTTSQAPDARLLAYARSLAAELGAPLVDRRQMSVTKLMQRYRCQAMLVATEHELRLYDEQHSSKPLVYHPSMAYVKLKAMLNGRSEHLIQLSDCREGDVVLDCTAGLCSDSLLFSMAVGASGKVIALESQQLLYMVVREGLLHYKADVPQIQQAMRRIQLQNVHHAEYLASLADHSVDIVYFDPMFRQPLHESSAIGAIRDLANNDALSLEVIAQAKRVARKCVLLKEHSRSDEFQRLGFTRCDDGQAQADRVAYGKIQLA